MSGLDEILVHKREETAHAKERRPLAQLEESLKRRPPVRGFRQAISRPGKLSLIAEVKKASPSAGPIRPGADILKIAATYEEGGARAISVLTDRRFFSGSLPDLVWVRRGVTLPVLRKDFILEEYQLVESAAAGADAVLLIAAILDPPALKRLLVLAAGLSLDVLVEVHSEPELDQALEAGAQIIGINNRDLQTFRVDLSTTQKLISRVPAGRIRVSESGIHSRKDVEFVRAQGADAILVGEGLMASDNPGTKIKELMG